MKAGMIVRGIVYTGHFRDRYHLDDGKRLAVYKYSISESRILQAIEEGLPEIAKHQKKHPKFKGLIVSRSLKLNMSFAVKPKGSWFLLTMMNMMVKEAYIPSDPNDYVVSVNPSYIVQFPGYIDRELRTAVLDDLPNRLKGSRHDALYKIHTPDASYMFDREGERVFIEDADWNEDMLYIDVR